MSQKAAQRNRKRQRQTKRSIRFFATKGRATTPAAVSKKPTGKK